MAKAAKKAATPKKPKADKKPRKVRAARGDTVSTVAGSNSMDPKMRELARHHRDSYITAKAALSKAQRRMQSLGKEIKGDGLSVRQIKLMVELSTPEGEAAWRSNIANDLLAAQYQGAAIGSQLSLFMEPDRTPSADIAFDEGIQDSMDGKTANPKYSPSVPQHKRYMDGYHQETERRLKAGIKPDVTPNPSRADTLAAARKVNEVPSPDAKLN